MEQRDVAVRHNETLAGEFDEFTRWQLQDGRVWYLPVAIANDIYLAAESEVRKRLLAALRGLPAFSRLDEWV